MGRRKNGKIKGRGRREKEKSKLDRNIIQQFFLSIYERILLMNFLLLIIDEIPVSLIKFIDKNFIDKFFIVLIYWQFWFINKF